MKRVGLGLLVSFAVTYGACSDTTTGSSPGGGADGGTDTSGGTSSAGTSSAGKTSTGGSSTTGGTGSAGKGGANNAGSSAAGSSSLPGEGGDSNGAGAPGAGGMADLAGAGGMADMAGAGGTPSGCAEACVNGSCDGDTCTCEPGWAGAACDTCATGFAGAACDECAADFAGSTCAACPVCENGGSCDDGTTGSGECVCVGLWTGATCSTNMAVTSGCSDGSREGFVDLTTFPDIAGCSGGFELPGLLTTLAPACEGLAGNDSENPAGTACNAADLCAAGWHICATSSDVESSSPSGCTGATVDGDPDLFFATRQSGNGNGDCNSGANDVFGCGNLGVTPSGNCAPLDRFSTDVCSGLAAPWDCGVDGVNEANNVTKSAAAGGGVLCCRDVAP
jgi:hypothetical protein